MDSSMIVQVDASLTGRVGDVSSISSLALLFDIGMILSLAFLSTLNDIGSWVRLASPFYIIYIIGLKLGPEVVKRQVFLARFCGSVSQGNPSSCEFYTFTWRQIYILTW